MLDQIRRLVRRGDYAFYKHALVEADKDGVHPRDAVGVVFTGTVIEKYPERHRCLIHGLMSDGLPLHVVCDLAEGGFVWIVTVYIPQDCDWIAGKTRR
ncbi:MAG: hypothetical protein AUJ96_12465 [Armatimonadetes bacterium CG2_30_66_41]|nr:DUF4258 domain-containing protein [Armatimonadota bacterium]NCO95130.1 DUF4258 domain-containing protein [Armatimonadota bacterium]NCP33871.1 DUF4258 domain-containing protein [Armatimonadota bacterium]NDK13315.1 DUF4258 domain-containing protein [Armatimonadota bacterium]OIP04543.1 MAG: hypothetical protein AUJ96_12465 [Armatimonadetes bacterium CG2_30_66_41]